MIQEYLSFSDLAGLGSSPSGVRAYFQNRFGVVPDGIALNNETYYNAVEPPITQQYSEYCYKKLGEYKFTEDSSDTPQDIIIGSNTAKNEGNSDVEIQLSLTGEWSETTEWTSSSTTGMSFSQEFIIEGMFKMGTSFNISVTAGKSESNSVSKSSSASVTVKIPPKSQVTVEMVATMKKEKMQFKVPITVSGKLGANFPKRVQDHYFWFLPAADVLPKISGEITGTIEGAAAFDVRTLIGDAVPI